MARGATSGLGSGRFVGRVVAIRGLVLNLAFEEGPPPIESAVEIVDSGGETVVAEIQAHLGPHAARAIALESTTAETRRSRAL